VLLIDDHQAQLAKSHIALDQSVRAHQQVNVAVCDRAQQTPALPARHPADQQSRSHPALRQVLFKTIVRLAGENLRRQQHGHLGPVGNRRERRVDRNRSLAAADVTLEQAGHRLVTRQIVHDLTHGTVLGRGQRERQTGADALIHHRRRHQPGRVAQTTQLAAALLHGELHEQQFVIGQPVPRDGDILKAGRRVHPGQGGLAQGQAAALAESAGQRFDHLG
jgi:hypothetical protein